MSMVNCCKLPGVRSFVPEVRSRSGNNVPVNLCQINFILYPDKKGQSPKAQLSPSKVPVLAKRRQISVGSSFGARFPYPAQLSSLREPGIQPKWPQSPQAVQMGRPGLTDCDAYRRPLLVGHRDRERFTASQVLGHG